MTEVRLKTLLKHVLLHVPFYSDMAGSFPDLSSVQLQDFPVLQKAHLQQLFPDLIAREGAQGGVAQDFFYITRTSGSTGAPCSHLKTQRDDAHWELVLLTRLFRELALPLSGEVYDLGLHWVGQPLIEMRLVPGIYLGWNFRGFTLDDPELLQEYLAVLSVSDPTVIYGAPSRICDLAHVCNSYGFTKRPRVVLSSYEQLSENLRQLIQETFRCRVVSIFGTAELGLCGWECVAGRVHFESDLIIPEVLTETGHSSLPGDVGRLVITSLKSWVMPLLRYETGDLAVIAREPCRCGKDTPSIERLEGRQASKIYSRTGRSFSPYRIMGLIDSINISQYQVVQTTPGSLKLIIPRGKTIESSALRILESHVSEYIGEPTIISVENTGEFMLTTSGKRNPVVQLSIEKELE